MARTPGWGLLGARQFSSLQQLFRVRLAVHKPTDTFYVAYLNSTVGNTQVRRWDGFDWLAMEPPGGITPGLATRLSLAVDGAGQPHLAFADVSQGSRASVMRYTAATGQWAYLGPPGFSQGATGGEVSLAFGSDDVPTLAFSDQDAQQPAAPGRLTVMRFSGGAWGAVGGASRVSPAGCVNPTLALDSGNLPWVGVGRPWALQLLLSAPALPG